MWLRDDWHFCLGIQVLFEEICLACLGVRSHAGHFAMPLELLCENGHCLAHVGLQPVMNVQCASCTIKLSHPSGPLAIYTSSYTDVLSRQADFKRGGRTNWPARLESKRLGAVVCICGTGILPDIP